MKRTKILILCRNYDMQMAECLEWAGVLEEHLGKTAKVNVPDWRLETPFVIIDFDLDEEDVCLKNRNRYTVVSRPAENDEQILRFAIGEEL